MKYYIIAGEPSGDLQASYLVKELKAADNEANIRCFGGELMKNQGATLVKHYKELAFMGFEQVIMNLRTILNNMKFCKLDITEFNPDVLILVDYPGFNLKIAKWAKANNITVYYYISPKIWAWNQKRVHKIKKVIDKMFVILPFEKEFYGKFNYKVDFVGHPLLDCIADYPKVERKDFIQVYKLNDKPIIAVLPGSRSGEIAKMLQLMTSIINNYPEYQFVVAGAPSQPLSFYRKFISDDIKIIENKTYDLLQHAHSAIVASGTATLETALFKIPQVICYKTDQIFFEIAKRVILVKYISLVNLIMDKEVCKELVQKELNTINLSNELDKVLTGEARLEMLNEYEIMHQKLGGLGASKRTAELMVNYLRSN
ncbi:MAG: lipid-A-disaccharide synthase [Vicingaceae bacterium]|nr:lipid-A-disaccharide synthase [Vicingaceae bacterium]